MNENRINSRSGVIALSIVLGISLIISAWLIGNSIKFVKTSEQVLAVKGYAEKNIRSDIGVWKGLITVRAKDLTSAYAKMKSDEQIFINHLVNLGINRDSLYIAGIKTLSQNTVTEWGGQLEKKMEGYILTKEFWYQSKDVSLITRLSTQSTEMISSGIEIQSFEPSFFYTKLNEMKITMLAEATKDARNRADQFAKNSGCEVGGLKSAQQGIFQITPVLSSAVSDEGEFNTNSLDKTIKAVVTVQYYIK